jgi:hemolysin activation/secretion protein
MNKIVLASVVLLGQTLLGQTFSVHAQVPTSVDPANIMNSVNKTLPGPDSAPVKTDLDDNSQQQNIERSAQTDTPLLLKDVVLSGATQPIPAAVAAIYKPLLGQQTTFGAIQQMAADMQKAYRDAGQFLVRIILPPQEIDQANAVVQLRVIEGQIEQVVFPQPLAGAVAAQMQRYVKSVEAENPINYATIDRFLLLANDLPGMRVSATLAPNQNVPGGSDLSMTTEQVRGSAFINVNNYGSKYVGPNQLSLGASLYDLIAADALSVAVATNPNRSGELAYGNLDYGVVLGSYGTRINASATVADTEPGSSLKAFELQGRSTEYRLSVRQPLLVSTPHRLTLLASLSRLNSRNDIFDEEQLYKDKIAPLMLGIAYQGVWGRAYNEVTFSATKGLPILGASSSLANPSVIAATPDFLRFNLASNTTRYFAAKTSVAFGTQFQYSQNRLVASERISYGGAQFGQAYRYNVMSGDSGTLGSLALRYDLPTQPWLSLLQPEIFYDAGTFHLNRAQPDENSKATATSAGIGLNLQLLNHIAARLTLAKPLSVRETPDVDKDWQGFFNITAVF